jgi:TIR domain
MSRIFLSHSSSNNAAALALAGWLEAQGWNDYFLDISESRGISPGERWMTALAGAVDRCEAVIFLVSPAWRDSKYCFAEFYQAKNLGKRIFGVIVEPIALSQLPEQMTSEWQVCDLTHREDAVVFNVERAPLVPKTEVRFPAFGLEALARGLRKAARGRPWPIAIPRVAGTR